MRLYSLLASSWTRSHTNTPSYPVSILSTGTPSASHSTSQISQASASQSFTGMSFHELKAELPNGEMYDFAQLKGKVVLIVNVASRCGFTPQYKGLQALYEQYKDRDVVVLGFPCNQFGGQEPGTDEAVAEFCTLNHGVTFPLMKKSDVNGENENEVYKYLKGQKKGLFGLGRIKWNFEKFLVDKEGNVVNRWSSATSPDTIGQEIEALV